MKSFTDNKKYESTAVLMLVFSVVASGFNYLFQIAAGRFLSTGDYGNLNSAFSFTSIVCVIGVALGMSIAKNFAENDINILGKTKKIIQAAVIAFIPFIITVFIVMHFLMHFELITSILATVSMYFISVSYIFYGSLQGKQLFLNLSIFNLFQPVIKFAFGLLALIAGFKYNVIFIVLTVGSIVSIIYGYSVVKKNCEEGKDADFSEIKPILKYLLVTIISTACLTFFNNVDVLIIRQYFPEDLVGLFSCSAVFGKIILYLPSVLVTMLFPIAARSGNDKTILYKTLLYSFAVSGIASVGLFVLKTFVIRLLMGEAFVAAAEYILPTVLYIIPLVLVTALVNYLIAKGDKYFTNIACVAAGALIITFSTIIHNSINAVLYSFTFIYLLLFTVLLIRSVTRVEK